MEINDLIAMQILADESNGFPVKFTNKNEKYLQITKDLVGLFGEIGEFSNIVKKINIKLDKNEAYDFDIDHAENLLKEELIDALIYMIRIAAIVGVDLEKEFLCKAEINNKRYKASK
ncbi:MAG: nucleotide pyrophosphohydrolase [Desulfuromonadaceae bacterium]